jgi:uncharacterized membrane protein YgcG
MKKIIFFLMFFAYFGFGGDSCPPIQSYNGASYVKSNVERDVLIIIDSIYALACISFLEPSFGHCTFLSYDSYKDVLIYKDVHNDGEICNYSSPFLSPNGESVPIYSFHSDRVTYVRAPDVNETCDAPNQYELSDDSCLDCSEAENIPMCICDGINDSYSGSHSDTYLGSSQIGGKCYSRWLSSCNSGQQFQYHKEVPCGDDNSTNTTTSGDNSTVPDNNTSSPYDNSTDNNSTSGGSGSGSGGSGGGISGGGEDGGVGEDNASNGTCKGDDCCDDWWCAYDETADPNKAWKLLEGEYSALYDSFYSFKNLVENGFALNVPSGNYQSESFNFQGSTVTLNACGTFSMFAPAVQFIVTICGFLLALKIYFWRF